MRPTILLVTLLACSVLPSTAVEAQQGVQRALTAIRAADQHGLASDRYAIASLESLVRSDPNRADSILTASLIRLGEDLRYGQVRPNAYSNLRDAEQLDLAAAVRTALAADTVPELMDALAPTYPQYRRLRNVLAHLEGSSEQAQKIRLTMERFRWLPRWGPERIVLVNIPAFALAAYDSASLEGSPALTMRVIVGRARSTRTPLLAAAMRTVDFRPFWNVPPSILRRELLPAMRKNPRYLVERAMEVVGPLDSVLGDRLDPTVLERLSRGEVRIRQRPTDQNALGRVKIEFPNPSSIFLHDTPDKHLFARERRDLSHGCIRLEAPEALASWALSGHPGWNQDSTSRVMNNPDRRVMAVLKPAMVILFYGTAEAAPDSTVRFYHDIYGLDRQLIRALEERQ
ncbi:MAG: L,D-transpeptidase family protein [Gemmatimonadales bacterium]